VTSPRFSPKAAPTTSRLSIGAGPARAGHPPAQSLPPRTMPRSLIRRRPGYEPPPASAQMTSAQRERAAILAPAWQVRRREPHTGLYALTLLLIGLFAVAAGLGQATDFSWPDLFRGADKPPPRAFPVLEPSRPMRLEIPAINVVAPVFGVGLAADGSVAVPPLARHNEAGWFDEGPTPGQFGPAVIVGHADTRTGPSVFHDLDRLRPGQRIDVTRRDGRVAVFEINSVERFGKSGLPVDRVYGDFSRPMLRLMTCGGRWVGGATGYEDNVVVFASLISSHRA
jgi:hypothetical protein